MARSSRQAKYVNEISLEQLQGVLGPDFENAIRLGVSQYLSEIGLVIIQALIQGEVESLCGQKHSRKTDEQPVRWGKQQGVVQTRGAKENIQRPRVRARGREGEIDL